MESETRKNFLMKPVFRYRLILAGLLHVLLPGGAQGFTENFDTDPGLQVTSAANHDFFTVGTDPEDRWVTSGTNSGAADWSWVSADQAVEMVAATNNARYFARLVSSSQLSAGNYELGFKVSWNNVATVRVYAYSLASGSGVGETFDIRGPDIDLTVPGAAALLGELTLNTSPGNTEQVIPSFAVGSQDQVMLIFGVENGNGNAAVFDDIRLTLLPDPDDTDADGLLDDWERTHFGENLMLQKGSDDFDLDRFSNITEQAFGTNPKDADSRPSLELRVTVDASGRVGASFNRFDLYGREYRLNGSKDLANWDNHLQFTKPSSIMDSGLGYEVLTFEGLTTLDEEKLFFQLEIDEHPAAIRKPNIILIYTDDLGYGDTSASNPDSFFRTPHMDRIANEGIMFTDGHTSAAVCTPSRYSLLTGRYNWRTTLKENVLGADVPGLIADGRMTIASLLRDNGYHTAMVGKWHLGMQINGTTFSRDYDLPIEDMPLDKGFDYFYGIPASLNFGYLAWIEGRYTAVNPTLRTSKKSNGYAGAFADYRITSPYSTTEGGLEVAADFEDYLCLDRFTTKAIEWMEGVYEDEEPFFIYVPYTSSHKPVAPAPGYLGESVRRGNQDTGAYGDFVVETDDHIGRILAFLEDPNDDGDTSDSIADDTMVIFSSDNGPESTYTQRFNTYGHDSAGILRGGKRDIYEGGHRVPFFIRWPAVIPAGSVWSRPVCQTDFLATFAEMLGVSLPDHAGEDSQSLLKLLEDPQMDFKRLPMISHSFDGRLAIRDGKWKLIMEHEGEPRELYDMDADPSETTDLLASFPEVEERLEATITAIVESGRTRLGGPESNDTGWWDDLEWIPQP